MEELLKALGHTPEQIKAIVDSMKNNKIYISKEENIDTRYSKLSEDLSTKDLELNKANSLISELQKSNKDNNDLQTKVVNYETEISDLKGEQEKKDIDNALKFSLLSKKAKADDIEYLMFKIKEKNKDSIKLDDKGNVKDLDIEDVKKTYPNHFEAESKKEIDVKDLGNGSGDKVTEPDTLLGALKEKYAPKNEI